MKRVKVKIRGKWQDGLIDEPPEVVVVTAKKARAHRKARKLPFNEYPHGEYVHVRRTDRGYKIWVPWARVDCRPDRRNRRGGRRT